MNWSRLCRNLNNSFYILLLPLLLSETQGRARPEPTSFSENRLLVLLGLPRWGWISPLQAEGTHSFCLSILIPPKGRDLAAAVAGERERKVTSCGSILGSCYHHSSGLLGPQDDFPQCLPELSHLRLEGGEESCSHLSWRPGRMAYRWCELHSWPVRYITSPLASIWKGSGERGYIPILVTAVFSEMCSNDCGLSKSFFSHSKKQIEM